MPNIKKTVIRSPQSAVNNLHPVTRNSQPILYHASTPPRHAPVITLITHRISLFAFAVSTLIFCFTLTGQTASSSNQPPEHGNLALEYSEEMGFAKNQVLDASITDSVLKLSINECSFCGAFKDDKKRSDIAHKTLDWFLEKTGQKEGTVEWYNKSQQKIMVITGSTTDAEITTGPSCAIQK